MRLYASPTSPYARLVRVVIEEKHLQARCETQWVDPWDSPEALLAANPFSRVPALETGEGTVLSESLLIALYLERRFPEPKLAPRDRMELVYRKLGLAHGLIDAAVAVIATRRFRREAEGDPLVQRRLESLHRAIPAVAATVESEQARPDLGDLALGVGLGYLDFRFPEIDWREGQPALGEWYARVASRPSLERTRPPEA